MKYSPLVTLLKQQEGHFYMHQFTPSLVAHFVSSTTLSWRLAITLETAVLLKDLTTFLQVIVPRLLPRLVSPYSRQTV